MRDKKLILISAFAIGAVIAIIFVTAAAIGGELYKPLKDWLAGTFSHHWIGKGIISLGIFYTLGLVLSVVMKIQEGTMIRILYLLFWITVVGILSISGFYVYEAFFAVHA